MLGIRVTSQALKRTLLFLGALLGLTLTSFGQLNPLEDLDDDNDGIYDTQELCGTDPIAVPSVINIVIDLDEFEGETSWNLRDSSGAVLANGGPYGETDDSIIVNTPITAYGTYFFRINDAFGDGMSSNGGSDENGASGYSIALNGVNVFTSSSSPNFILSAEHIIRVHPFSCLTSDPHADEDSDGIINYQDADYAMANGSMLNAAGVMASLDFDGDGLINSLDTDSDGDFCFDAVEGDGTVRVFDLNFNGDGMIDANEESDGLPRDPFNDFNIPQAIGTSQDSTGASCRPDATDNDGVSNEQDLDDDNDGINDAIELCGSNPFIPGPGVWTVDLDEREDQIRLVYSGPGFSSGFVGPFGDASDTVVITNNFPLYGFHSIVIFDGIGVGGTGLNQNGGSDENGASGYTFFFGDSLFFQSAPSPAFGPIASHSFTITPFTCLTDDPTRDTDNDGIPNYREANYAAANGSSLNAAGVMASLDFDGDGIINSLDTDSDNDGCPDALEGDSIFNHLQINADGRLLGPVDGRGIPVLAGVGQGLGLSRDASIDNCVVTAISDTFTIPEDSTGVLLPIQDNDFDPDLTGLTTTILDQPNSGTASVSSGGDSIAYTPTANFFGNDTLIYRICDTSGMCDEDTVFIVVTPVNDAPVANPDAITIPEDTPFVTIDVNDNDTDIENDTLAVSAIGSLSSINGSAIVLMQDSIAYAPAANYFGQDTITYQVCDPGGLCDTSILVITVTNVPDAPIAAIDRDTTVQNSTNNFIDVQDNDTELDNETLTTSIVSGPTSGGSATIANGDSINYAPPTSFFGNDTIMYQVCDPGGLCDTTSVIVYVMDIPDAPEANADMANAMEDGPTVSIDVQANDLDVDNDPFTTALVSGPTSGAMATVADGDSINYTPDADFFGVDTLMYSICDPGGLCDTAQVLITVANTPDAPVANSDMASVNEDSANNLIDVQGNDTDVDNDALTTTILAGSTSGGTALVVNGDSISYTPAINFVGADTIIYQVCDPGALCDNDTLFINILNAPDAPVATADMANATEDGAMIVIDVQTNDSDLDNDPLTTSIVSAPISGAMATVSGGNSIQYTPDADFFGQDTLMYQVCDPGGLCDTAIVVISVSGTPDAPVAATDNVPINEDSSNNSIDVQANDTDVDDEPLTTTILSGPTSGGTANVVNGDSINYTPPMGFFGVDTIIYQVCDPTMLCDIDTVFINVTNLPDAPVANNDTETVTEDAPASLFMVQANDSDADNDPLTTSIVTGPTSGAMATVASGTDIQYTPNADFFGQDTIQYQVCDPGGLCDTALVIITVNGTPDAPVAATDNFAAGENSTNNSLDVQDNDVDVDNETLTTTIISGPTSGGTATVVNGDSINYTPPAAFFGADTIIYQVCDPTMLCDIDTVFIQVADLPDTPIANADAVTIDEDAPTLVIDVQDNDSDADNDPLTTTLVSGPTSGSTAMVVNGDSISYTPNLNYFGADTIVYQVCDPGGLCDMDTLFITVNPINDTLIVDNETHILDEDNQAIGDLTDAGDSDIEGGLTVNTTPLVGPSNGSIVIATDGSYTYTPDSNFFGLDTVVVEVCDLGFPLPATCLPDTIFIELTPVNDAPTGGNEMVSGNNDLTISNIDLLANNTDVELDNLSANVPATSTNGGTVVVNPDGTINYTPTNGFTGNDTILYTVCDDGTPVACVNDTVLIMIGLDSDSDGVADAMDLDDDNDGIPDAVEMLTALNGGDTDGDGVPDHLDLDSDGDGFFDIIETGGTDANDDGVIDTFNDGNTDGLDDDEVVNNPQDTDNDGTPDFQDTDADGDGVDDMDEGDGDEDGDGVLDFVDQDSDNDGIPDAVEMLTALNGGDTDGDGVPDHLDLDSDGDGLFDIIETGGTDADGDGMIDNFNDSDGDGLDDDETVNNPQDTDNDGQPDFQDTDADGDGVDDMDEGNGDEDGDGVLDFVDQDSDNDGIPDDVEMLTALNGGDTDGDGIPDHLDLDSDGDGIFDILETGGTDSDGDGMIDNFNDSDGDGLDDDETVNNPQDTDGDGLPNFQDLDSDGDGINDEDEGAGDEDGDGIPDFADEDSDNDGIPDSEEWDTDGDGIGPDDCDGDGIPNFKDRDPCTLRIPEGFSPNGDGIHDVFVINGITAFPRAQLHVFNRWGNLVYESPTPYNNDWDGTSNTGLSGKGSPLTAGTYYYVLEFGDDETENQTGWVVILR